MPNHHTETAENPMLTMKDRLLTSEQVAKTLGVTVETLRVWRREGRGPAWERYSPRVTRYREADVLNWRTASYNQPD